MKRGFTLIEVTLAMAILAGGVLTVAGLYSFGFKEGLQSREDVVSAALADAVVSPLVMVISQTNLKWSVFKNISSFPSDDGWGYYLSDGKVRSDPNGNTVYNQAKSAYAGCAQGSSFNPGTPTLPSGGTWKYGLVVMHEEDSPVVRIGFRATQKKGQLLSVPLYYTEVRFQGIIDQ